jgi:hypothetical protein
MPVLQPRLRGKVVGHLKTIATVGEEMSSVRWIKELIFSAAMETFIFDGACIRLASAEFDEMR